MIEIHRPTTGTTLTIENPLGVIDTMSERIAIHLNGYVDHHYPGFEIVGFA